MSTSSLDVWLHTQRVARLKDEMSLQYTPELVDRLGRGALCLSISLPVEEDPYRGDRVRWWVEGLLPEGESRTHLETRYEVRRGDAFSLIAAIGRDCAGAVSFVGSDEHPPVAGEVQAITTTELGQLLADLPNAPLGNDDEVHVSLGGLQAKLLLCKVQGGWARPVDGTPSTHILKPDSLRYPGLVATENFSLALAREVGLDAAVASLEEVDGRDVLIVERFDRFINDQGVQRRHQEDGCQALGIDPTGLNKYERRSGPPSYNSLAQVLIDHGHDPQTNLTTLIRAMTFVLAIGDTDAHARNHGFLLDEAAALAPLYDVAPSIEFAPTSKLALRVCGLEQLDAVTRAHLHLEARSWGLLEEAVVDDAVDSTLESMRANFEKVDRRKIDPRLLSRMRARIERIWKSSRF